MKTRSKIGNKKGNPAYRTPSVFRANRFARLPQQKITIKNPATRAEWREGKVLD